MREREPSVDLKCSILWLISEYGTTTFLDALADIMDDTAATARQVDLPGNERAYAALAATIRQGRAEAFGPPNRRETPEK